MVLGISNLFMKWSLEQTHSRTMKVGLIWFYSFLHFINGNSDIYFFVLERQIDEGCRADSFLGRGPSAELAIFWSAKLF